MLHWMLAAALAIPAPLANYRSWTPLTPKPYRIPGAAAAACMSFGPAAGPHADRWITTWVNPLALKGLDTNDPFPPGAVIAKEKLRARDDSHPEGVAFMIKRRDGWEFRDYPSGPGASYERCADCHRDAAHDSVFSTRAAR